MSRASTNVKNWRKRTKDLIIKSMGGKCQICGYNKCSGALELHHIDPKEKEFGFGGIRANPQSFDKMKVELKKCILLCSNCHKEVHMEVTSLPENYQTFDESLFITERDIIRSRKQIRLAEKVPVDRRKILLTNDEIKSILVTQFNGNKSEMARHYGVSETSIRKRLTNP
jgi:ribosomal protein L30E